MVSYLILLDKLLIDKWCIEQAFDSQMPMLTNSSWPQYQTSDIIGHLTIFWAKQLKLKFFDSFRFIYFTTSDDVNIVQQQLTSTSLFNTGSAFH